jgi:hypothetical protein
MTRFSFMILAATLPLFASDTITLRDGTRRAGTFVSATDRTVTFEENGATRQYDLSQVQSVQFDPAVAFRSQRRNGSYADRPGQHANPSGTVIPANTEVSVRTNEPIQSTSADLNRYYSAVVDRDVTDSTGRVVIPRGSSAQLVVRDVTSGGATGSRQLTLDLQSVTVNGSTYYISTEDLQQTGAGREGLGKNKRTGEMVGGGAALGTLLGAIAGGGKGAAIGAVAGAATGAGVQVLTRGKEVRVPAETVLNFRLDQPLRLSETR